MLFFSSYSERTILVIKSPGQQTKIAGFAPDSDNDDDVGLRLRN